jgi:hypothetical protein
MALVLPAATSIRFWTLLAVTVLDIGCGASSTAPGRVVLASVGGEVISKHGLLDISASGDRTWAATIAPRGETNLWEVRNRQLHSVAVRFRADHVIATPNGVWVVSGDQGGSRLSIRYVTAVAARDEPRVAFRGRCRFHGAVALGAQLWVVCGRTVMTLSWEAGRPQRRVRGVQFSTILKAGGGIWLVQSDGLRGISGARGFIKLPRVDRSTWSSSGATVWRVVLGASRVSHVFRIDVRARTFHRYTVRGPFPIDEVTQVGRELWGTNLVSKRIVRYRLPSPHQPIGIFSTAGRSSSGEVEIVPARAGAWIVCLSDGEQSLYRATLR